MADYKEMYLTLFRVTEQAISIMIEAQRKCEDLYLDDESNEDVAKNPEGEDTLS